MCVCFLVTYINWRSEQHENDSIVLHKPLKSRLYPCTVLWLLTRSDYLVQPCDHDLHPRHGSKNVTRSNSYCRKQRRWSNTQGYGSDTRWLSSHTPLFGTVKALQLAMSASLAAISPLWSWQKVLTSGRHAIRNSFRGSQCQNSLQASEAREALCFQDILFWF